MKELQQLKSRNRLLYYFGLACLLGAALTGTLSLLTETAVLGINAYIKPLKFFLSSAIFSLTFAWLLVYLLNKRAVRIFSWITVLALTVELVIITGQAAQGKRSHFNFDTPLDDALFAVMGLAILVFTLAAAWITVLLFRQRQWPLWMSEGYKWGIRLGFLFFVVFAFEGGHMVAEVAHTIGAADGGEGLPLLNWSLQHGDLRVPHFFGMHSLQLLPLAGYYAFPQRTNLLLVAGSWLLLLALLYWQALLGFPLIP